METLDYRYYLTELIRMQGQGQTFSKSLYEMEHPQPEIDPAEIVAEVIKNAGLEVTDGLA